MSFEFFYSHVGSNPNTCLSNFYPVRFTDGKLIFKNSEQYLMYHKAMLMGDKSTAQNILRAHKAYIAKALGRKVEPWNQELWDKEKETIMVNGLMLKFGQNKNLRDYLLSTVGKTLVEAAYNDPIWGVGMALGDPNLIYPDRWKGQNLLGKCLEIVRAKLMEQD